MDKETSELVSKTIKQLMQETNRLASATEGSNGMLWRERALMALALIAVTTCVVVLVVTAFRAL